MNSYYHQLELPLVLPPNQRNPYVPLLDPYWEELVGEQVAKNTVEILVGEQVTVDTQKSAHQQETTHWVEKYWVQRGLTKYWYYRYTWMVGRKMHRCYIGSVRSPQAMAKVQMVKEAITSGLPHNEIKQLISFS